MYFKRHKPPKPQKNKNSSSVVDELLDKMFFNERLLDKLEKYEILIIIFVSVITTVAINLISRL